MRSHRNDPRHTAVHEAGHAVIARVLTLSCGGSSINADVRSAGRTIVHDPETCIDEWKKRFRVRDSDKAIWYGQIIACMAGREAEVVILGSTQGGDGDDQREIEKMSANLCCGEFTWPLLESRLRSMTRMLARRHQKRIETVAEALLAKKTLTASAVDKLAGRSVNDVKVNAPFLLAIHQVGLKARR